MSQTITVYPSEDVSVGHSTIPSQASGSAYTCVTHQDDDKYLQHSLPKQSTADSKSSSFRFYGVGEQPAPLGKIRVNAVTLSVRHKMTPGGESGTGSGGASNVAVAASLSVSGVAESEVVRYSHVIMDKKNPGYEYRTDASSPVEVGAVFGSLAAAGITAKATTYGNWTSNKSHTYDVIVDSMICTVDYDRVWDCAAVAAAGVSSASVSKAEAVDGEQCTFTAVVESGWNFESWYWDSGCTDPVPGADTASFTIAITGNTTLYARAVLHYDVTVYCDGHCTAEADKNECEYGETVTVTASDIESGMVFDAWCSNPALTTVVSEDNPYSFAVTRNTVLYARTARSRTLMVKDGTSWAVVDKAYKKIDGLWVEQESLDGLFDAGTNYIREKTE